MRIDTPSGGDVSFLSTSEPPVYIAISERLAPNRSGKNASDLTIIVHKLTMSFKKCGNPRSRTDASRGYFQ
jgi:hypothetical protein